MNFKIIIYVLLNYILAISTLLYSIIKRTSFISFFKDFTLFFISFNAICFCIYVLLRIFKVEEKEENFEMDIKLTEQEARDLMKDLSEEDKNQEQEEQEQEEQVDKDKTTNNQPNEEDDEEIQTDDEL